MVTSNYRFGPLMIEAIRAEPVEASTSFDKLKANGLITLPGQINKVVIPELTGLSCIHGTLCADDPPRYPEAVKLYDKASDFRTG